MYTVTACIVTAYKTAGTPDQGGLIMLIMLMGKLQISTPCILSTDQLIWLQHV